MASLNKVILLGNLTRDPELKYAANSSGTAICRFGMAINTPRGGEGSDRKEDVCFVDIVAFGRQAETASEYLAKGRMVLIEGRLSLNTWETQDGQKRSKHEVIAERVTFMPRPQESGPQGNGTTARPATTAQTRTTHTPAQEEDYVPPIEDDDIPF